MFKAIVFIAIDNNGNMIGAAVNNYVHVIGSQ